jgi:hypothetical protein
MIPNPIEPRELASNQALHRHGVGGDDTSIDRTKVAANQMPTDTGSVGTTVGREVALQVEEVSPCLTGPGNRRRRFNANEHRLENHLVLGMNRVPWYPIEACIANEHRATNGSPDPRGFTSELPNISWAGTNKKSVHSLQELVLGSRNTKKFQNSRKYKRNADYRYSSRISLAFGEATDHVKAT